MFFRRRRLRINLGIAALAGGLLMPVALPSADAATNLASVQAQVLRLQQQATSIAESAQAAQVDLNNLSRTLASVQQQASVQQSSVSSFQKSLGAIAAEQYKSGGLGQGMQLLFSSDPTLYLAQAGTLEMITQKKALQLKKYQVAKQRLVATSLTVNDKLALVKAARARFVAQQTAAYAKLKAAQQLLSKLTKADRARLARLAAANDSQAQKYSIAQAAKYKIGSGRGASALKFALKQIGDRYVFGAAGMIYWDCSGLVMRAFGSVGVSLPHSAAYQYGYGKFIPRSQLKPGDIVFFGRPITHDGIYLGNGMMVDAPHSGARVRVESFGSHFGYEPYIGAKRI